MQNDIVKRFYATACARSRRFECNLRKENMISFGEATCLWSLQIVWILGGNTVFMHSPLPGAAARGHCRLSISASVLKTKLNVSWTLWSKKCFLDNENNQFSGWPNPCIGYHSFTDSWCCSSRSLSSQHQYFCFQNQTKCFLETLIHFFFKIMQLINVQGDLTDISAKKEVMLSITHRVLHHACQRVNFEIK